MIYADACDILLMQCDIFCFAKCFGEASLPNIIMLSLKLSDAKLTSLSQGRGTARSVVVGSSLTVILQLDRTKKLMCGPTSLTLERGRGSDIHLTVSDIR